MNVSIHNDNVLEEFVEVFTVSLETVSGLNERIILSPEISRVLIFDYEGQLFINKVFNTKSIFYFSIVSYVALVLHKQSFTLVLMTML